MRPQPPPPQVPCCPKKLQNSAKSEPECWYHVVCLFPNDFFRERKTRRYGIQGDSVDRSSQASNLCEWDQSSFQAPFVMNRMLFRSIIGLLRPRCRRNAGAAIAFCSSFVRPWPCLRSSSAGTRGVPGSAARTRAEDLPLAPGASGGANLCRWMHGHVRGDLIAEEWCSPADGENCWRGGGALGVALSKTVPHPMRNLCGMARTARPVAHDVTWTHTPRGHGGKIDTVPPVLSMPGPQGRTE